MIATPNCDFNKEINALLKMMDSSCDSLGIMVEKLCKEYNVSIKLVDSDMGILFEYIIDVATHVFMIRCDNNMFELLEDNIVVTSYFACSSGC